MAKSSEHWDFAGMERHSDFAGIEVEGPTMMAFRGADTLLTAAKVLLARSHAAIRGPPPPPPPPPPKPDVEALERFVREELGRLMGTLTARFNRVDTRVDMLVESSVRNESHVNAVQNVLKTFEKNTVEAFNKAKESLSQEMKALFEAELKEYKEAHEKSPVQNVDAFIRDLELAATFPERLLKLTDRAMYHLAVLGFFLSFVAGNVALAPEECAKIEDVKPKLDDLGSKLEELPKKCTGSLLQKGKFSDMAETSEDLLHRYFHSGPKSGFDLSFSVDAAHAAGALIFGDWGPISIIAPEVGPWALKLKTRSDMQINGVRGSLNSPFFDFHGLIKGGISVPVPASSVKANLHYLHEYGAVRVQVGPVPLVNLSCVFGFKAVSLGADLGFNPVDRVWTKYDGALRFNTNVIDVAMLTKDKNDKFSGSVCCKYGESWSFGIENSVTFSTRLNKLVLGLSHAFDPVTTLKARIGLEANVSKADEKLSGVARLKDTRVLGGLALVRRFDRCAAGVSVEVDLLQSSAPRFGLFLKFGAPKKVDIVEL